MKKILLFLVFLPLLISCEGAGELGRAILNETNKCDEYSVVYHITNTNNCNDASPDIVYLTSEEYQRLYNIVSNASPSMCVFVSITPKDGSPLKVGYIKDFESFLKITKNTGAPCN